MASCFILINTSFEIISEFYYFTFLQEDVTNIKGM